MFRSQHKIKNATKEKGIAWVVICIAGAVVLALTAGSVLIRSGTESPPLSQPADATPTTPSTPDVGIQPETEPTLETDFVEQGVTVENCQFFYERPGALALIADLVFVETSMCDVGNGEKLCSKVDTSILRGQSTKMEGHVEQEKKVQIMGPNQDTKSFPSVITVHKLTILQEIVPTEFGGEACVPSEEYISL